MDHIKSPQNNFSLNPTQTSVDSKSHSPSAKQSQNNFSLNPTQTSVDSKSHSPSAKQKQSQNNFSSTPDHPSKKPHSNSPITSSNLSQDQKKAQMFLGFSKLNQSQRYDRLLESGVLTSEEVNYLKKGGIKDTGLADKLIENVIGYFQIPLGLATHFIIDEKPVVIPMAVEETSIIAAASKTAKWVAQHGRIQTHSQQRYSIGQIQIHEVKNFENLKKIVFENEKKWIQNIHTEIIPTMVQRGGGIKEFRIRKIPYEKKQMAVIHVLVNTCDSMGANVINQICESLKEPIEQASNEKVSICILSNLADTCLASAQIKMEGIEPKLAQKIEDASIFSENDSYRAATSNKGVMNGIDAVLIALGNDFRAVEAGIHSYSTRKGHYQSITKWRANGSCLKGFFEAPLMVGVVGGMTRIHPTARICMKMMGVQTASDLARICAAVGLVQNLGAIRALTTVGIIEGHMKLHAKNLTQDSGAKGWEFSVIQKHLESLVQLGKKISLSHATQALEMIRKHADSISNKQEWASQILKDVRNEYQGR